MDDAVLEKYRKAGEVAKKAEKLARDIVKPGAKVLDIADKVEGLIWNESDGPAFPLNISINEMAAHYTPDLKTELVFGETDLVKVDLGVHFDGYIADRAFTLSMDKDETRLGLIEAAEAGLKVGLECIRPGVTLGEIGTKIEEAIVEKGFKPISNLTGHGLEQYSLHTGLTIPNIKNDDKTVLEEGQAIAIEPFSTNGYGAVIDSEEVHIYEFLAPRSVRNREARRILELGVTKFKGLPFARRWLEKDIGGMKLSLALRELVNARALYQYPALREKERGLIAQAEHTVIVLEDPIITTR
ncbi:MAG: type II methionyl aminopeptidase [archaeon]